MFRKRFGTRSPSRSFGGRRSFSRPRLRDPQRTMRLEKAEFYIRGQTLLTNGSETEQHVYTHIASIPLSLGQFISSSLEQRVGATLQSM